MRGGMSNWEGSPEGLPELRLAFPLLGVVASWALRASLSTCEGSPEGLPEAQAGFPLAFLFTRNRAAVVFPCLAYTI